MIIMDGVHIDLIKEVYIQKLYTEMDQRMDWVTMVNITFKKYGQ